MIIKTYITALFSFLVIDFFWLAFIANDFYQKNIGFLISENVNWFSAILFYLIFIAGLVCFVILPALQKKSRKHALIFGAFFGIVTYATYDLTNMATIANWPLIVTIVDLIWGAFIASIVSVITYLFCHEKAQ